MRKFYYLLILISSTFVFAQSMEDYAFTEEFLNDFALNYYEDCFDDRVYVSNSIKINNMIVNEGYSEVTLKVEGMHQYYNYIDYKVKKEFKANIKITESGAQVKFEKQGNFLGDTVWESCYKTVR